MYSAAMNRILTTVVISSTILQAGCLFRTTSPISGAKVTAQELQVEQQVEKMKESEQHLKISQQIADAQRDFDRQKQEAARNFELACAEVHEQADDDIRKLARQYQQSQLSTEQAIYDTVVASQRAIESLKAKAEARNQSVELALKDLEEQQKQAGVLLNMVESVAGGFGATGGAIGAGVGLLGTLFGLRGRKQAVEVQAAASRVIDAIDVLKQSDQNVAASFKANAGLLNDWMGEAGKKLVDEVQGKQS